MSQLSNQMRTYYPAKSAVFLKTNERFGGLSNMAPHFPIVLNGIQIRTSEALYQACRFPHQPDIQYEIINERSPMTAKMKSKKFRSRTRPDWNRVRIEIMRWCLRIKLVQNLESFGSLLLSTNDMPIVEKKSRNKKDDIWGAIEQQDGTLVGRNVLGHLLMELREELKEELKNNKISNLQLIKPLDIPDFLLFSKLIKEVKLIDKTKTFSLTNPYQNTIFTNLQPSSILQPSLF